MAIELQKKFSVDIGNVVSNSIAAVKSIRKGEQARKESEFQKAVANGMSYEDQLKFREKQLEDEKMSSFYDTEYIDSINLSIATTKKLARFETIQIKYKQSLDDYVSGKESISQHISILEDLLDNEQDPTKQEEIRGYLSTAITEKSNIELNAIKNRSILAQKDTSISLLDSSISEVKSKRTLAAINENDDEVATWDDTLLSLNSAKSKLLIQNGLNEITYQTNRSNLQSSDKLKLLNGYVSNADDSNPVIYDGVTYPSLKAYWENKRGEYISNSYFDDVKKELDTQTETIAATNSYGQIPVPRIQAVNDFYNTLKNKTEFTPYVAQIEQQRLESVTTMANNLYTSLVDEANSTGNFAKAETAILGVENKLGIKIARPAFSSEVIDKNTIAEKTIKDTTTPITSEQKTLNTTSPSSGTIVTKAGDTLSAIANQVGMTLPQLLELNPKFKENPNIIGIGENIKVNATPTVTPTTPVKQINPTVVSTPNVPTVPTPLVSNTKEKTTATPIVTTPTNTSTYSVMSGDTLSKIALKNDTTVANLVKLNNIKDANKISIGQKIKLQ